MQFRSLEFFCSVAQHRSFSKAASASDVTQSAVSQAMQQLEESVGVKLIDRSTRPLTLTPAGKRYHEGLRGILRSYRKLESEVRTADRKLVGEVRVGTIYSVGLSYMPDATDEFARLHENVSVGLEFGNSDRVGELVSQGIVDFGLVSFPRTTKKLAHVVWQHEPMRLVCDDKHPLAERTEIAPSDLQGVQMVGFDQGLVLRQEIDRELAKAGIEVDFAIEFDNADSMVRAIQANQGIGFVPEAAVRRETAAGSLRVIACREFHMTRPLGIIVRRSADLTPAAIEFASLLLGRPFAIDRHNRSPASVKSSSTDADFNRSSTSVVA